jgi:glutamine synthetase
VLNTIAAESIAFIADKVEKLKANDFAGLTKVLSETIKEHQSVLFAGNNYSDEWHAEAAKRGLPNNKSTVEALPALQSEKAKKLFSQFAVLNERELESRYEISWERYVKVQNIEANTSLEIAKTQILPAVAKYLGELASASKSKGLTKVADKIAGLADALVAAVETLEAAQEAAHKAGSLHAEAKAFKEKVIPAQDAVRAAADELETLVSDDLWPLPKYRELLFQLIRFQQSPHRLLGGEGFAMCTEAPLRLTVVTRFNLMHIRASPGKTSQLSFSCGQRVG